MSPAREEIGKEKCPHCFREFSNLRHHVNQQHIQVFKNNLYKIHIDLFVTQMKNYKCGDCGYVCYLKSSGKTHYECS